MKTDSEPFRGIVYVATGDESWSKMCLTSIASLRDRGYQDYFFIITDQTDAPWPQDKTIIHSVPKDPSTYSSRHWKTQAGLLSPFSKSIYLDCDILAIAELKDIWREVKADGIGFTSDMYPTLHDALTKEYRQTLDQANQYVFSVREHDYTANLATRDRPYYNGGLVSWSKNEESIRFFSSWHNEWKRFSQRDQFALARALYTSGVTAYRLPGEFNFNAVWSVTLAKAVNRDIKFVHFLGKDQKRAIWSFTKQIEVFNAIDASTQKKLEAIFRANIFKDRDVIFKLWPLIIALPPKVGFRVLLFVGLSILSIISSKMPSKFRWERSRIAG